MQSGWNKGDLISNKIGGTWNYLLIIITTIV